MAHYGHECTKISHFIGPNKPWHNNRKPNGQVTSRPDYCDLWNVFLQKWWNIYDEFVSQKVVYIVKAPSPNLTSYHFSLNISYFFNLYRFRRPTWIRHPHFQTTKFTILSLHHIHPKTQLLPKQAQVNTHPLKLKSRQKTNSFIPTKSPTGIRIGLGQTIVYILLI